VTTGIISIGLAFRFLCRCFPKVIRRLVRQLVFLCCIVSPCLIVLAWALLWQQPNSFSKDTQADWQSSNCKDYMCTTFYGNTHDGSSSVRWGPDEGWWLVFAAFWPSVISMSLVLQGRKRFKYTRV